MVENQRNLRRVPYLDDAMFQLSKVKLLFRMNEINKLPQGLMSSLAG